MNRIVLFGDGKIAEEIYSYFTGDSSYEIVAFTVDAEFIKKKSLFGKPIVPFEQILEIYPPNDFKMFVALGYQDLNRLRERKCIEAKEKGYELVSYICSKASNFGNVEIGENSLVLENAVIQPFSIIGDNVFIWSGNHIGHHAEIKDHSYICGHAIISGNAVIGRNCFIGVNSTIGHNVTIGDRCILGAGTLVTKDALSCSVFIRPDTEKYRLDSVNFMKIASIE